MQFNGIGNASPGKIEGVVTVQGGVYANLSIDGVVTVEGDLEADNLTINGVCTCKGGIVCDDFSCDGVLTVTGDIRADLIDVDGIVSINGEKAEADRIVCDGVIKIDGEVSADVIEADGLIDAKEIVGDRVTIKSYRKNGLTRLMLKIGEKVGIHALSHSSIEMIEATTVDLRGVHAKFVSGHDVTIRSYCKIDRVECGGALHIDPDARVGEIVGKAT